MVIIALVSPSLQQYFSDGGQRTRRRVTVEPETNLFTAVFDSADSPWWAPSASPLRERLWTTCRSRTPRHRPGCSHWGEPAGCSCWMGGRRRQSGSGPFGTALDSVGGLVTVKRQQLRCLTGSLSSFTWGGPLKRIWRHLLCGSRECRKMTKCS